MARRFAERHRQLVNVLIQQNVQLLLEGPLTQLMRAPRLIDFDNKRLFFRNQVRSSSDRYHGSLRIHVRREHLFEDSFHQLRSKCALFPTRVCVLFPAVICGRVCFPMLPRQGIWRHKKMTHRAVKLEEPM